MRDHLDEIKRLRFDEAWTLNELAERYGVSRERIRQILVGCGSLVTRQQVERVFHAVSFASRLHLLATKGSTIPHGEYGRYRSGCRCRACRDALAAHIRNYYARTERRCDPAPPERRRAYREVNNAIKEGRVTVPLEVKGEKCGAEDRRTHNGARWLQAHHEDYARPLDVVFLCCVCHRQIHARTSDG